MKDGFERELKDLIKDIQEYRMELEAELKGTDDVVGLEKQLAELKAKLDEKGTLSAKDRAIYKRVANRIKEIKNSLASIFHLGATRKSFSKVREQLE